METKRMREAASVEARPLRQLFFESYALLATRFFCVNGSFGDEEHGVMLLFALRYLRRYSFDYLKRNNF